RPLPPHAGKNEARRTGSASSRCSGGVRSARFRSFFWLRSVRLALVLMGGGARAAYQVGALKALAQIAHEVAPLERASPFTIVCGTSAGAINAASIASHADDLALGVGRLIDFWSHIQARQVYRTDWLGVAAAGARWLAAMSFGWAVRRSPRALFDNSPLADLL